MSVPAEIVATLATVAEVNGWRVYRLHGSRTDPTRASAPDLVMLRDGQQLVAKVQSEANACKNGLTDRQAAHLEGWDTAGAYVMHVTTAPLRSEAEGALSVAEAIATLQDPSRAGFAAERLIAGGLP